MSHSLRRRAVFCLFWAFSFLSVDGFSLARAQYNTGAFFKKKKSSVTLNVANFLPWSTANSNSGGPSWETPAVTATGFSGSIAITVNSPHYISVAGGAFTRSTTITSGQTIKIMTPRPLSSSANPVLSFPSQTFTVSLAGTFIYWTSSTTTTFTAPSGSTQVRATVIGGGGGGAGGGDRGGGGGGGGLSQKTFSVTGGESFDVVVGGGGVAGFNGTNGSAGGLSSFGNATRGTITGNGGSGTQGWNVGGPGGSASGGSINYTGGSGGGCPYSNTNGYGGGGGGVAGLSGNGSNGVYGGGSVGTGGSGQTLTWFSLITGSNTNGAGATGANGGLPDPGGFPGGGGGGGGSNGASGAVVVEIL